MNQKRNTGISNVLVVIIIAVLGIAWYGYHSTSKRKELDAGIAQLNEQAKLWDDANRVAAATPRIGLPSQISAMQAVKRNVDALNLPECLHDTQKTLASAMDATLQGYLTFMANTNGDGEKAAASEFMRAKELMHKFQTVKAKC